MAALLTIIILSATINVNGARSSQGGIFQVFYDSKARLITVIAGTGDFLDLVKAINNSRLVKETYSGVYMVMRSLTVGRGVTLRIEGPQVAWVRLLSNQNQTVRFTIRGFVEIVNTKLTSWNSIAHAPQTLQENLSAPRAHILVEGGTLNIINSEISYLGYSNARSYGISYYDSESSRIENSTLAYNYRSFFSVNSTNFIIARNKVYGCNSYGLDPFAGSLKFLVENNTVYANGSHGIIVSTVSTGNIIRNNHVYNNSGHGIMLHDFANMNSVYGNLVVSNSLEGIVVFNSSSNVIYSNRIVGNENGIRLSEQSTHNEIRNNTVEASRENGIYVYALSDNNVFSDNVISNSGNVGLYLKNSNGNVFRRNISISSAYQDLLEVNAEADIDSSNRFGSVLEQSSTTSGSISENPAIVKVLGFGGLASFVVALWLIQRRRSKKTETQRTAMNFRVSG